MAMASRPSMHQRVDSHDSSSSSGSSSVSGHRLVLEHILSYPGTYELPLRTMYSLNLKPRAQPMAMPARAGSSSSSASGDSPTSPTFQFKNDFAAQQLTSSLLAEISQMSSHQNSLPPSFVTAFLRKCFAYELELVDFPQALTGLDYLKDLESRRRKEIKAALERLEINVDNADSAESTLSQRYPGVLEWYRSIQDKENKVIALYTQLYIALRRWILLNELQLSPFSKHNCVAMLNTVYPPLVSTQPTPTLTPVILKTQRDGFFKYIQAVEKKGPSVLKKLMEQGKRPDQLNGWSVVRETLDKYLILANSMIDECSEIRHIEDPTRMQSIQGTRGGRKVDSGISFNDARKKSDASTTSIKSVQELQMPQSPPPLLRYRSTTTLEKIARELKHMARNKTEISEIITQVPEVPSSPVDDQPRGLRKMKSLGSINFRRGTSRNGSLASSRSGSINPAFDVDEMRRQRLVYESRAGAVSQLGLAH